MTNEGYSEILTQFLSQICKEVRLSAKQFSDQTGIRYDRVIGIMISTLILELVGVIEDD